MNNKYFKPIAIVVAVLVITLTTIASYAFFTANLNSNAQASVITTGNMSIQFIDGNLVGLREHMVPGDYVEKHFTVKNTGDVEAYYDIYFNDVVNSFSDKNDLVYELISDNGRTISETTCPDTDTKIARDITIGIGETQDYVLKITFKDDDTNQDDNKGKEFSTLVSIEEVKTPPRAVYAYLYDEGNKIIADDKEYKGYTLVLTNNQREEDEICPYNSELNKYCCDCSVVTPFDESYPTNTEIVTNNNEFSTKTIVAHFGNIIDENLYARNVYDEATDDYIYETNIPWDIYGVNITRVEIADEIAPKNTSNWFNGMIFLNNLDLSNLNAKYVTNMSGMFNSTGYFNTNFTLNIGNKFDTSNVTDMTYMFSNYGGSSLDLSGFNTAKVTDMSYMFDRASNITNLDLSSFDTSKVTNMTWMFSSMDNLSNINISSFDTSNVTDMSYMFSTAKNLTSLDLRHFNTSNVTTMDAMFSSTTNLASLNLSGWDTHNVTNIHCMFRHATSLTNLDLSGFDTSNVTNMEMALSYMTSLTNINLSGWNTSNVERMNDMFQGDSSLTVLDLSSFDTSNVTLIRTMFSSMSNLTTIYVGSDWNIPSDTDGAYMFYGDTKLKGGAGTTYNSSRTDKTYARIDDPSHNRPGYFTLKTT